MVVGPPDVPVLEVSHISSAPDLPLFPRHLLRGTPAPPYGSGDDAGPQHEDSGAALSVGGRSVEDQTRVSFICFFLLKEQDYKELYCTNCAKRY